VAQLFSRPSPGLGAVRIGEHALAILRGAGLSPGDAVAAFSGIIALNYGWSSFTTARELDPSGPSHDVASLLAALPAAAFPRTVEVAGELGAYGGDDHYELVLAGLTEGLPGP
jgi:hypothetical protein